ncbi:MFS transporter [Longispora albida]|uniref:MFS transporter n=1 Tax=Longispora albida TaxID=203523 RepID=UPI0003617B5B|nr:MFS transporter [Longispora albida]
MTATLAETSAPAKPYRNPAFLGWLGGYWVSLLGDQIYFIAFAYAAAQLGDPLLTSVVAAASSLPRAVLLLFGGALGDRVGLRKLMLTADALRAAVMLAAALAGIGGTPIWLLLAASLIFGVVDAAYLPAVTAFPAQILPGEQLPAAAAARSLAIRAGLLVGAPLGGLLAATGGFVLACAVNAVTFTISVFVLARLRPAHEPEQPPAPAEKKNLLADVGAGLRYVASHPTLRLLFVVLTAIEFLITGPVNIGISLIAVERGWGSAGPGWMFGALGLGAVAGSLLVMVARKWSRPVFAGLTIVILEPLGTILLGLSGTVALAAASVAMIGFTGGVTSALLGGTIQRLTAPGYRARIGSIFVLQGVGLVPVALTGFGALAGWLGTGPACVACGTALALVVIAALCHPVTRRN